MDPAMPPYVALVRLWFGPGRSNFFSEWPAPAVGHDGLVAVAVHQAIIARHFPESVDDAVDGRVLIARFAQTEQFSGDYMLLEGPPKGWRWLAYNGKLIAEKT